MDAPAPLREVIERHGLAARKSLGQHFLLDLNITRKIAALASVKSGDRVLEIGPGPGGLTRALLEKGAHVTAVERDHRCIEAIEELEPHFPGRFTLIEADALGIDELKILNGAPAKIVANLPYNIATELLIKWLKQGESVWSVMALMFQKEVAERILAAPGSKSYGRLSIIAQALSAPSRLFDLPARAFTPPPKVASSVVLFARPAEPFSEIDALEKITHAAFSKRRKMLRSSLKSLFGEELSDILIASGATETQRAEELSVTQFKMLSRALAKTDFR